MTYRVICSFPRSSDSYSIEIHNGCLNEQAEYLASLAYRFAIITDTQVGSLYGTQLQNILSDSGLKAELFCFPTGEQHKTRATKELLENQLFEKGFGKDSCIIALGGGVVTDLVGFLAATYCRGVPLVLIPTSLLAMVDASVGGKTGVNVPYGKNMVGSIYQPRKVIIDPSLLKSLPTREVSNGLVEMVKHGLVADAQFFQFLETNAEALLALEMALMEQTIFTSCRIKKVIVEEDETEQGRRRILNFGHTVGHAFEAITHYSISHGQAVALGMVAEAYMSSKCGPLPWSAVEQIKTVLQRCGSCLRYPNEISSETLMNLMSLDKKACQGTPRFVLLNKIGCADSCTNIDKTLLKEALDWLSDAVCLH